jgi:hypothetical protein
MTNKTSGGAGGLLATRGRKITAAIAAAFIASIGAGLGAWAFQAAKDKTGDILDTSAPISVRVEPAGTFIAAWPGGETYVFPSSVGAGPDVLSSADRTAAWHLSWGWAAERGGVAGSPQIVRLEVRGKGDEEVSITRISARVVQRSKPVKGWFLRVSPGCEAEQVRMAEIDLDSPNPAVLYYTSFGAGESKTLSLTVTRVDSEQIELLARTRQSTIDWEVEVFYSAPEGNGSVVKDDSGKPFRVTAETASKAYGVGKDGEAFRVPEDDGTQQETVC